MNDWTRFACLLAAPLLFVACTPASDNTGAQPSAAEPTAGEQGGADAIYHGGNILTMEGDQPAYVEAVAVDDGKIIFAGTRSEAEKLKGAGTVSVDLGGKTMMPGLIDGHAHFLQFGSQAVGANLLAPPDGSVNTVDDIVAKLKEFGSGPDVARTGWIFGTGYDDALLGRHPTREDLDKVSTEIPVLAVHISGHLSAMNTAGLRAVGITADTPDPEGGRIRREADGRTPSGVLEELASIPNVLKIINPGKQEDKDYFLARGIELAKSYGYTTAAEGRMMGDANADLMSAAKRGLLDIDVIGWQDYTGMDQVEKYYSKTYTDHYRLGGLKITLDGSPQGRTAWRTRPYLVPPDGQKADYKGYPAIPDTKQVESYIDKAYTNNWPVKIHANGDAAVDQMIAALEPVVKKHGVRPGETILVHGQFIRADQIPKLKELGIFPSMFPMHTFYWGDWYDTIVGHDMAVQISPMRSIMNTGLHVTSHTDAPVALPNLMQVAWATVNRVSRSGKVVGEGERVTPYEAMKMITLWSAEEFGEDEHKGSIKAGKQADLVILSDNPVAIEPMNINKIVVLETIKDGKTVSKRE
ncbi:amidohydrolase [Stenotrophomonas sp. SY1]|uniref:amidohydrolase n=1 Tax=Stenotrophomonas sp. SY1 TaxID=477235 RepID=UPI001E3213AC|nr:amidohydrolase [Stenotrophomonas sp. SY1]MCD9087214.1 amidohydrolase [Stenotrophomonas sp. SY1]